MHRHNLKIHRVLQVCVMYEQQVVIVARLARSSIFELCSLSVAAFYGVMYKIAGRSFRST